MAKGLPKTHSGISGLGVLLLVGLSFAFVAWIFSAFQQEIGEWLASFLEQEEENGVTILDVDWADLTGIPNILSSLNGVVNHEGNIDLIGGSNITITPDDEDNTITIDVADAAVLSLSNADTLNGLNSLQFLRSNTSDNYTSGTLTFDEGTLINIEGRIGSDLVPVSNAAKLNLGSTEAEWELGWIDHLFANSLLVDVHVGELANIGTAAEEWDVAWIDLINTFSIFPKGSSLFIGGDMTVDGDILPDVDGIYDLGSLSFEWDNAYTHQHLRHHS